MSVVLVATIVPAAEHRDAVIAAVRQAVAQVHGEPGCELYALHEGPDRLVMVEKWASPEALAEHARGPALADLNQALAGRTEGGIDVQVLRPHPAGTPDQGTL